MVFHTALIVAIVILTGLRLTFHLQLLFLSVVLVRHCQLSTTFSTTSSQYATAVLCSHSLTETVFVLSLSVRGLECSFHLLIFLYVSVKKVLYAIQLAKLLFFLDWQSFTKGILTIFDKILFKETHYSTHKLCSHSLISHRFKWKACRQHLIITNICNTGTLSITIKNK